MIPYFSWQTISLGPITLQVWGICVALGALIALFFCLREIMKASVRVIPAKAGIQEGVILNPETMWSVFFWLIFGGFIGARIFHIIFYEPIYYWENPAEILKIWHGGASSLGGFAGALAGLWIFLKNKKIKWTDFRPYAEIIGIYFWLGWAIGRIGCFLIHDHVGRLTNFFLSVNFPYGARYDLGLMDSILALIIFFILLFTRRVRVIKKVGSPVFGFMLYAFGRFFLDFLRADDVIGADARYWHLTPAQWGIVGFFIILTLWRVWGRIKQQK
ncbi:MAG: prolipoprotein diacylglyceryl transferase [Patescibacteria group bacterium]